MVFNCQVGDNVLVTDQSIENKDSEPAISELRKEVGETGVVMVLDFDFILQNEMAAEINSIFIGLLNTNKKAITEDVAEKLAKVLVPGGRLVIKKSTKDDCTAAQLISTLKLSGFISVIESKDEVTASKPNYAVGSAMKLKSTGAAAPLKVWQLDEDSENEELVNEDDLLDEDDLKKPDPSSLKVCGTTGKRKACTNCSCGLAEELENTEISKIKENTQNAKSSCGSCYLGDAFRCASCPYIGMPAFKPGEKVTIDTSSDI